MPTATLPPHHGLRLILVLAAFAAVTGAAENEGGPSGPTAPPPAASGGPPADGAAADSRDVTPAPPPQPAPRVLHPQPNLHHATPRYEARFAVPPADADLLRRLGEPLPPGGIRLAENATVLDVQDWLSHQANMPARLDWRSFEEMGLDSETPLPTNEVDNGPIWAALRELLDAIDLTVIVKQGALMVTSQETAEENLTVGFYPLPTQSDPGNLQPLIDLIQATIAPDTWDCVGGPAAIRPADQANALAISQTQDVHAELLAFMRSGFDADLSTEHEPRADQMPTRVHRVRDAALAAELEKRLAALCNQALGPAADPSAKVTCIGGDRLVVQSASRPFQVYAAELLRAIDGVEQLPELPGGGGMPIGGPFLGGQ